MRFLITASLVVQAAPSATIPPEVKKAVTFIYPSDAHGDIVRDAKTGVPTPYGTGFFVFLANEIPPRAGGYGYLVTAKHVLKAPTGASFSRVYLRLNKLKGDAEFNLSGARDARDSRQTDFGLSCPKQGRNKGSKHTIDA